MTNLECVIAVLARHREARRWTDEAVAHELCAELGLEEAGEAANARAIAVDPAISEAEVLVSEGAAKEAADVAAAKRAAFENAKRDADAADRDVNPHALSGDELRGVADDLERSGNPERAAMLRADAAEADRAGVVEARKGLGETAAI